MPGKGKVSITAQFVVVFAVWLGIAIVNGLRDMKDGVAFWRRPLILVGLWLAAAVVSGMIMGCMALIDYIESVNGPIILAGLPVVCLLVVSIISAVGLVGCSIVVPWMDSWEIKNFI